MDNIGNNELNYYLRFKEEDTLILRVFSLTMNYSKYTKIVGLKFALLESVF
jgi:hypothetical protein